MLLNPLFWTYKVKCCFLFKSFYSLKLYVIWTLHCIFWFRCFWHSGVSGFGKAWRPSVLWILRNYLLFLIITHNCTIQQSSASIFPVVNWYVRVLTYRNIMINIICAFHWNTHTYQTFWTFGCLCIIELTIHYIWSE